MPASLRAAFIRSRQQEAAALSTYYFRSQEGASLAQHPTQGYSAVVSRDGLRVALGSEYLGMALRGVGCESVLADVAVAAPVHSKHHAELDRRGLVEWYENGPLGLEQGFTVAERPACDAGERSGLRIELALTGTLTARRRGQEVEFVRSDGRELLHYGDLAATDADGRALTARMEVVEKGQRLALLIKDQGARYPIAIDPLMYFTAQQKLTASDQTANASYGVSAALSTDGNTALVGAYQASIAGMTSAGEAYIYTRAGATWTEQQKLTASDRAAMDRFGQSVALSADGNTAVVGSGSASPGGVAGAGAAYVYTRAGTAWTQQQKIVASDQATNANFGQSAALSSDGNTALVGAYNASPSGLTNAGAVYVYTRTGTTWTQQQKLVAAEQGAGDQLGQSAALSADGNTALIGALNASPNFTSSAGAAYVYTRTGTTWTQQQRLIASDQISGNYLGSSVALSGDGNTALVGAPGASPGNKANAGAAYLYLRAGATWTEQQHFIASDKLADDGFGHSLALSGDGTIALISAWLANSGDISNAGVVYVYARTGPSWIEQRLTASDGSSGDSFGSAVALSADGKTALVGAQNAVSGNMIQAGATYVFAAQPAKDLGNSCIGDFECKSSFCVTGVCCEQACGNNDTTTCQSCLKAQTGLASDGSCGMILATAAHVCRPAAGVCDAAAKCDGRSTSCAPNAALAAGAMCIATSGVPGTCDGVSAGCAVPATPVVPTGCSCQVGGRPELPAAAPLWLAALALLGVAVRRRAASTC